MAHTIRHRRPGCSAAALPRSACYAGRHVERAGSRGGETAAHTASALPAAPGPARVAAPARTHGCPAHASPPDRPRRHGARPRLAVVVAPVDGRLHVGAGDRSLVVGPRHRLDGGGQSCHRPARSRPGLCRRSPDGGRLGGVPRQHGRLDRRAAATRQRHRDPQQRRRVLSVDARGRPRRPSARSPSRPTSTGRGEIGLEFAQALAERAKAGVPVKMLLDAVGSATIGDEILRVLEDGGCQLAWYNPIRWYTLDRGSTTGRTASRSSSTGGSASPAAPASPITGAATPRTPSTGATCRSASRARRSCRCRPASRRTGCERRAR